MKKANLMILFFSALTLLTFSTQSLYAYTHEEVLNYLDSANQYDLEEITIEKEQLELEVVNFEAIVLVQAYAEDDQYKNELAIQVAPILAVAELNNAISNIPVLKEQLIYDYYRLLLDIDYQKELILNLQSNRTYLQMLYDYETQKAEISQDTSQMSAIEIELWEQDSTIYIAELELAELQSTYAEMLGVMYNEDTVSKPVGVFAIDLSQKTTLIEKAINLNSSLLLLGARHEAAEVTFDISTSVYDLSNIQTYKDAIAAIVAKNNLTLATTRLRNDLTKLISSYEVAQIKYKLSVKKEETLSFDLLLANQRYELDLIEIDAYLSSHQDKINAIFNSYDTLYRLNRSVIDLYEGLAMESSDISFFFQ